MLSEKQILLRQLASTSDPMRQARIQRELADMCLSSALDLADAACTRSEGYKKICENAVVFCRQALERQMAMVEVGNCSPEEVSDTWYMLGRAHEALSEGVDAPEGLSNKQYAL